jgi:spore germination protein KC
MNKLRLSIIIIITLLILSGCWDSRQLEDVTILFGIALDINEENQDLITVTVAGPTTQEGADKEIRTISASGRTVREAIRNIQSRTDREVMLGHLRILFVGRELAERGITQSELDSIGRDAQIRGTLLMAVVDGRAQDLMYKSTADHPLISLYISEIIESSARRSLVVRYTLRDFFQCWSTGGRTPIAPMVSMDNPKDPALRSTAIFSGDQKMAGELDTQETFILIMLKNQLEKGRMAIPFHNGEEGFITAILSGDKRSIKTRIEEGQVYIDVHIKLTGNIIEYTRERSIIRPEEYERIVSKEELKLAERRYGEELEVQSYRLMEKLKKEYKADPVGFGNFMRAYQNDFFQQGTWLDVLPDVIFNINVDVKLKRVGVST